MMQCHFKTTRVTTLGLVRPKHRRKQSDFICEDQSLDVGEAISPAKTYCVEPDKLEKMLKRQFGDKLLPAKNKKAVTA